MSSIFKTSKEEKLKALSNKIDFYVMELSSYTGLPYGDAVIKKQIVDYLNECLRDLLEEYKKVISD